MYDIEALKRLISKIGPNSAYKLLSSETLPEPIKKDMKKHGLYTEKGAINIKFFSNLK